MKNKRSIKPFIAATLIGATAATTYAGLLPDGYTWGLYNCGPAVYNSETRCMLCCDQANIAGTIDIDQLDGCNQMCQDSVFNAPIGWRYWGWIAELIA